MEKIRKNAIENPQPFMHELKNLNQLNMTIFGDTYVKDHYPEIKNEVLKDLLNRKSFYFGRDCPINESVYNGQLLNEISNAYNGVKGLYILLKKSQYMN